VAAYPVDGPLQVLGDDHGKTWGGVLSEDLKDAVTAALALSRQEARDRAESFAWPKTVQLFKSYLVPVR
jgi:hypothetical protein